MRCAMGLSMMMPHATELGPSRLWSTGHGLVGQKTPLLSAEETRSWMRMVGAVSVGWSEGRGLGGSGLLEWSDRPLGL